MIKDELRRNEPVAYRSLENALKNDKVAHSYLFSGEYSPLKIETAYLLAMSIIEGKHDFACEECNTCRRIRRNEYFDVVYVDGYKESIKKDDVGYILDEFSRTALEKSGKKVYILANVNNSSNKVLNMILRFMEEPSNVNTYGIFITDSKADLLPTVVSRCQEISFLRRDFSYLIGEYEKAGFDHTDAYLLSDIRHSFDESFDLNDQYYLAAKDMAYKTVGDLDDKDHLPVLFNTEYYPAFKQRNDFRKSADYYLAIMIRMIEDALHGNRIGDDQYDRCLDAICRHSPQKLLEIFLRAQKKVGVNAERKLLFDALCYEIILYI